MKMVSLSAMAALLAAMALPGLALEPNPACQALDAWVSQLDKLPADYESFLALDPGQRRAVYQKLSDGERAALWRRQLGDALATDGWNENQRALIAETERLMTEDNFAAMRPRSGARYEAARLAFKDVESRIEAAFPRQEALQLFFGLGPRSLPEGGSGELIPLCNCNVIEQDCDPSESCQYKLCSQTFPCGFTFQVDCDGVCR